MRLQGTACPFLRHEFLAALEHTGCVGKRTGWTPAHLAAFEHGQLVAAAPAYRKSHSWGEFVFDFGWAQAYERHGLAYYPKLRVRRAVLARSTARACCSRRDARELQRRAGAGTAGSLRARIGIVGTCAVHRRWRTRGIRGAGLAAAPRRAVPLAQSRLCVVRPVPGNLQGREAQEGPARTAPLRGSRHHLRDPVGWAADTGTAAIRPPCACAHLPAARARALPQPGVLHRAGAETLAMR